MKQELSEKEVNRLAQRFYEASGIPLPRMTDKPLIVAGLRAVFDEVGIPIVPDRKLTAEEAMLQIKAIFYDGKHEPAVIRMNEIFKIFRSWEKSGEV